MQREEPPVGPPAERTVSYTRAGFWAEENGDTDVCLFKELFTNPARFRPLLQTQLKCLERYVPRRSVESQDAYLDLIYYYFELAGRPDAPDYYVQLVWLMLFVFNPPTQTLFDAQSNVARLRLMKVLVVANLELLFRSSFEECNVYALVQEFLQDIRTALFTNSQTRCLVAASVAWPLLYEREAVSVNHEERVPRIMLTKEEILTYADKWPVVPLVHPATPSSSPAVQEAEYPPVDVQPVLADPATHMRHMPLSTYRDFYSLWWENGFMHKGQTHQHVAAAHDDC
jgi:hypothetical protein